MNEYHMMSLLCLMSHDVIRVSCMLRPCVRMAGAALRFVALRCVLRVVACAEV